jgi:Fur family ferric uptake transcriptional regulator
MMEIIKKVNGNADRASVYRTVSVFERLGVVHRLNMGWKYKLELNDGFMHHHHHMTCISCGIVIPLEENHELEERILELPRVQNFLATDHQLEIRGICSSCQRKTN